MIGMTEVIEMIKNFNLKSFQSASLRKCFSVWCRHETEWFCLKVNAPVTELLFESSQKFGNFENFQNVFAISA